MTYFEEQRMKELEQRVETLERSRSGDIIRGWSAAGKALGVGGETVKRWYRTDPRFPKPVSVRPIQTKNALRVSPEWTLAQLQSYR